MPRRSGWFLVIEGVNTNAAQPVGSQRDVCAALRRLAPIIPREAWVSVQWRAS